MESDILLERKHFEEKGNGKRIRICGTLLEDALYKRNPDWKKEMVDLYRFRHGAIWRTIVWFAFSLWIISTILQHHHGVAVFSPRAYGNLAMEIIGMVLLLTDMAMKIAYRGLLQTIQKWWEIVFLISIFFMLVDMLFIRARVGFPWSRMFQPFVLFCILPRVRNSAVSTVKLLPDVLPVLVLEWISILVFSCLAVVLFRTNDNSEVFFTLSGSLLAMIELSTAVTNPDVWLYVYDRYAFSALFFIGFLVLHLFLLHNIVLAVIRKGYNAHTKLSLAQEREWHEEAIRMSFKALEPDPNGQVLTGSLLKVLKFIRPHYNDEKINMLLDCILIQNACRSSIWGKKELPDVEERHVYIEWDSFKEGIMQAVNLRLYSFSPVCTPTEWQSFILNVIHVWNIGFLLWGCMEPTTIIYHRYFWSLMSVTTIVACVPHCISLVYPGFIGPWRRLSIIVLILSIAGLAFIVVFMASGGWSIPCHEGSWDLRVSTCLLMTGRCLDTVYILSQFKCFRDLAFALGKAIPYAESQLIVILSVMHIFAVVGMGLWAGKIDISTSGNAGNFYYKLNFNTFPESMVTLFQVIALNNWQTLARMYAELGNRWGYVYFIVFIVFAVSIIMNVLAAIAIDAFVNEAYKNPETNSIRDLKDAGTSGTKDTPARPHVPRNASYGSLAFKKLDIDSPVSPAYMKGVRRQSSYTRMLMQSSDGLVEGGFSHALLASLVLGLGDAAGFQISTAYVMHNGEITSPPHVYLENKEFTALVKSSIDCTISPRSKTAQSSVSLEAYFLKNIFYEKIREAIDFIVSPDLPSTAEYLIPAVTLKELPCLVHTERVDIGPSGIVEITCTVVEYQDSNLTILYIANRQCIEQ